MILLYFLLLILMLKLFCLWRPLGVKQPGEKQVPLLGFTTLFHTHQMTHY